MSMPVISPNGQFVAYQSNESGDWEVFVTRFFEGKGKWQVSVNGGMHPRWNGAGDELLYVETGTDILMAILVESADVFRMDLPQQLFKVNNASDNMRMYDVMPDSQRFVVVQDVEDETPRKTIIVVENWYKEFEDQK